MSTVEDLKRKVQSLKDELNLAEERLFIARLDEYPVKIGQTVLLRGRHAGERAVVSSLEFYSRGAWVSVRRFKKDGTLFANEYRIFNDFETIPSDAVSGQTGTPREVDAKSEPNA